MGRVPSADRARFEQAARQEGLKDFQILEGDLTLPPGQAKARAAEMNKGRENLLNPGTKDAAELMADRTRDYQFTKSMLNMGYNNTIMQMAAISGNQWRYK